MMGKDFRDLCDEKIDCYIKKHIQNTPYSNTKQLNAEKAWVDCYREFKNFQDTTKCNEKLANLLHDYLAKWGLMRGKHAFFKKDLSNVHDEPINIMFKCKYRDLWNIDKIILDSSEAPISLLASLQDELENAYVQSSPPTPKILSAVALTKVLLGTMGCAPAFDTNFRNAVKIVVQEVRAGKISYKNDSVINALKNLGACNSIPSEPNPRYFKCGMSSFLPFMRAFNTELTEIQEKINNSYCSGKNDGEEPVTYPLMKIVDMIFWTIGAENSI